MDGFQGREKEAVVISMVRSNTKGMKLSYKFTSVFDVYRYVCACTLYRMIISTFQFPDRDSQKYFDRACF